MGKRNRKTDQEWEGGKALDTTGSSKKPLLISEKAVDPSLALLFASSAGPVQAPPKSRYQELPPPRKPIVAESEDEFDEDGIEEASGDDDDNLSSVDGNIDDVSMSDLESEEEESTGEPDLDKIIEGSNSKSARKRKRAGQEEDLEGKYMEKLAREEQKEQDKRDTERKLKRQKVEAKKVPASSDDGSEGDENMKDPESGQDSEDQEDQESSEECVAPPTREPPSDIPVHESLAPTKDADEVEKASRTVFLANVSSEAVKSKSAKKTLMAHMGSFIESLPDPPAGKPPHKVESIRFRSTAYATGALPKKAAYVKKDVMEATTKSTNAYVVYSTAYAAREAVKRLNGSIVLDRHLRVDGVAHPAKTDHRRCVFVGNLGFVDDESLMDQGGQNERKRSKIPSDIEEGLWRQFGKAGTVESVRVVRDEKTRVGKGFAYVQFEDPNSVETALLFNEKKYPPMLPRILRVVRAKAVQKTALASKSRAKIHKQPSKAQIYNPKTPAEESSNLGRAAKLLGRAGAAKLRKSTQTGANTIAVGQRGDGAKGAKGIEGIVKTPETIVFEGYRASAKNGKPNDLKMGGKGKGKGKKGKPVNRGAKRAGAWKKAGGKKMT